MDGDLLLIPTDPAAPYPLGRAFVWHDPRNRLHRALPLGATGLPVRSCLWYTRGVFNQTSDDCTANAAVRVMLTSPFRPEFEKLERERFDTPQELVDLYHRAQEVDPWPGVEYAGTSTDAPWKVLTSDGIIPGWRWLFGFDEAREWIGNHGPFAAGTEWYNSMFTPDPETGFIKLDLNSGLAGGHAYAIVGYSDTRSAFRIVNSWGTGWGQAGRAWISAQDMRTLLERDGEAVTLANSKYITLP